MIEFIIDTRETLEIWFENKLNNNHLKIGMFKTIYQNLLIGDIQINHPKM